MCLSCDFPNGCLWGKNSVRLCSPFQQRKASKWPAVGHLIIKLNCVSVLATKTHQNVFILIKM